MSQPSRRQSWRNTIQFDSRKPGYQTTIQASPSRNSYASTYTVNTGSFHSLALADDWKLFKEAMLTLFGNLGATIEFLNSIRNKFDHKICGANSLPEDEKNKLWTRMAKDAYLQIGGLKQQKPSRSPFNGRFRRKSRWFFKAWLKRDTVEQAELPPPPKTTVTLQRYIDQLDQDLSMALHFLWPEELIERIGKSAETDQIYGRLESLRKAMEKERPKLREFMGRIHTEFSSVEDYIVHAERLLFHIQNYEDLWQTADRL